MGTKIFNRQNRVNQFFNSGIRHKMKCAANRQKSGLIQLLKYWMLRNIAEKAYSGQAALWTVNMSLTREVTHYEMQSTISCKSVWFFHWLEGEEKLVDNYYYTQHIFQWLFYVNMLSNRRIQFTKWGMCVWFSLPVSDILKKWVMNSWNKKIR